jgi:hypothetical protein
MRVLQLERFARLAVPAAIAVTALNAQIQPSDLLQLHVAEYNALTTRNTYMITLQYSLMPVFLIYVPLMIALRHRMKDKIRRELVLWGGFAGVLLLGHFWAEDLWQQFNNVKYIETQLRHEINQLTHGSRYWCYEHVLAIQRGTGLVWWEWGAPVVALVLLILIVVYKQVEDRHELSLAKKSNDHTAEPPMLSHLWIERLGRIINYGGHILCIYLVGTLFVRVYMIMHLRLTMVGPNVCP